MGWISQTIPKCTNLEHPIIIVQQFKRTFFSWFSVLFFRSVMKVALPTAGKSVFHAFCAVSSGDKSESERERDVNNGDDRSIKTNRIALAETWQTQMIPNEHKKKNNDFECLRILWNAKQIGSRRNNKDKKCIWFFFVVFPPTPEQTVATRWYCLN